MKINAKTMILCDSILVSIKLWPFETKIQTLKASRGRKLTPKHRDLVICFASLFSPMFWILLHPSLPFRASWWNHLCGEMLGVNDPNFPTFGNFGLLCERPSVSFTECKSSTLNPKNILNSVLGNMASWWKHGIHPVGVHPKIHQNLPGTRLSFPSYFAFIKRGTTPFER